MVIGFIIKKAHCILSISWYAKIMGNNVKSQEKISAGKESSILPLFEDENLSKSYFADSATESVQNIKSPEEYYSTPSKSISDWIQEWEYKNAKINLYTHQIHQYPAMFIPQIIRKLLLEYSNEGDLVVDIFNGSGTTSVECMITNRESIGIELNPLASLIAKVKTTVVNTDKLLASYLLLIDEYFDSNGTDPYNFPKIEYWFTKNSIIYLSHLLDSIKIEQNEDIRNIFEVSFSGIIRYVSTLKHDGFKMHLNPKKQEWNWTKGSIFNEFHKSFCKSLVGLSQLKMAKPSRKAKLLKEDSCNYLKSLDDKVDLIITSPPYGDSRTTVAYGQFSRLSSQWLGLIGSNDKQHIENIDKTLLGGNIANIDLADSIIDRSRTLNLTILAFNSLLSNAEEKEERVKIENRTKDVLSFYIDLEKSIENGAKYLKTGKHFILITGSRVVRGLKMNTDLIIAELSENYGLVLDGILCRKTIPNKRMPPKVSATNVVGEIAPTITKENIVILRKI